MSTLIPTVTRVLTSLVVLNIVLDDTPIHFDESQTTFELRVFTVLSPKLAIVELESIIHAFSSIAGFRGSDYSPPRYDGARAKKTWNIDEWTMTSCSATFFEDRREVSMLPPSSVDTGTRYSRPHPGLVEALSLEMNGYVNTINGAPIVSTHSVPSAQNSIQGALKRTPEPMKRTPSTSSKSPNILTETILPDGKAKAPTANEISSSLDLDIQRQLEDYNRSITIVVWYRAGTEPIRLHYMNPTFPYFQLLQLEMLVKDLALTAGSFIDTYNPYSGTWEQHTMGSVRRVATQQRLLYKTRRSLLDGLSERDCPGLPQEVATQALAQFQTSSVPKNERSPIVTVPTLRKRAAPDGSSSEPVQKVHVPNHCYPAHVATTSAITQGSASITETSNVNYVNSPYPPYPSQIFYPTPAPATTTAPTAAPSHPPSTPPSIPAPTQASSPIPDPSLSPSISRQAGPQAPSASVSLPPIPYHPHPPLKRWPNDYTVSELTSGFHMMDALVRDGGGRGAGTGGMTQRAAFERVFGSRYVKSTVCRHRGVWRKAAGPLREQYERMGTDERACWGEFVRRVEGRPPGKATQVQMQMQTVGIYQPHTGTELEVVTEPRAQAEVIPPPEEPAMASLQNPDGQASTAFG
ncbi:hypothetical protein H2248_000005 [Termitomyces sp. 'cryptogamus']|nr:hypothetical protein H2248_000005 [Termitomyces sp. 'cryptogamus']